MNDNQSSYTEHYMVTLNQGLALILNYVQPLNSEVIPLDASAGRVIAEDIYSPISVPTFDNSAMDGYAVNAENLLKSTNDSPTELTLSGVSVAGDNRSNNNNSQMTAWKIMTGAPIPKGYDSVIAVENTQTIDKQTELELDQKKIVRCFFSPKKGSHIRLSGEDFVQGELVLKKKQIINSNRIMALSSLGVEKLSVVKKPKIAVFSTGKELVDDLTCELKLGQIYNSNMPYVLDYLKHFPVDVYNAGTNYDRADLYRIALQEELSKKVDLIISTGAVSMGDFDFIPQTIINMGGEIIFHKVKIRPGKPILFARFPNGSYYIGLPGNPISAAIGLRFFATHLIRLMLALPTEKANKAQLDCSEIKQAKNNKKGFIKILKAHTEIDQSANLCVSLLNGQESFKIHPLLDANAWVLLDDTKDGLNQFDLVDFYFSTPVLTES